MANSKELQDAILRFGAKPAGKRNGVPQFKGLCECGKHDLSICEGKTGIIANCLTTGQDKTAYVRGKLNGPKIEQAEQPERPKKLKPSELPDWAGFTLTEYSDWKKLSQLGLVAFFGAQAVPVEDLFSDAPLRNMDATYRGKTVIGWPYMDPGGRVIYTKLRLSKDSNDTLVRPAGAAHVPYGLWLYTNRQVEGRWNKDIVLCEGESNVQTCFAHNISCLGIPGANRWIPAFAELGAIKNAERVFIFQDADAAGEKFVESIAKDLVGKALVCKLRDYPQIQPAKRDLSDLHINLTLRKESGEENVPTFRQEFQAAIDAATIVDTFPPTDMGNTERLIATHGPDFFYVPKQKIFYLWNEKIWEPCDNGDVLLPSAKDVIRAIPDDDWRLKSESFERSRSMIKGVKAVARMHRQPEDIDPPPTRMLLSVQNGTIELKTQTFRAFRREDYISKIAPVTFDAKATCPKFEQFVNFTFDYNQDTIHFIRKALGYCLSGDIGETCFFICHGVGANGKTTLVELLGLVLGDDFTEPADYRTFTVTKGGFDPNTYDLETFRGKRLVTASEPPKSSPLNEAMLKYLTGGDRVKGRMIYKRPVKFVPECKLWLLTNYQHGLTGTGHAIERRIRYIPFTQIVPEKMKIKNFHQELYKDEGPGILNWLLLGVRDWIAEGVGTCDAVAEATAVFIESQDLTQGFFDTHCILGDPKQCVAAGKLYARYLTWAERTLPQGELPLSGNAFADELTNRGCIHKPRQHRGGARWCGIMLKDEPEAEEPPPEL